MVGVPEKEIVIGGDIEKKQPIRTNRES